MKDPQTGDRVVGRTRWRRFMLLLAPGFAAVFAMGIMIANGAILANFSISGMPFTLSAAEMTGDNFIQFAAPDQVTNPNAGYLVGGLEQAAGIQPTGAPAETARDGKTYLADTQTYLKNANITALHQTVCAPLPAPPGISNFWNPPALQVTIDAGRSAGAPAHSPALVVQAPGLAADNATFTNIMIGADTSSALSHYGYSNDLPASMNGGIGLFSQAADSVDITGLTQIAVGTEAGSFSLPGLTMSASFVDHC